MTEPLTFDENAQKNLLTFTEVESRLVEQAARRVAHQYWRYMVTVEDCKSEIYLWLYSDRGRKNVERWLANEPQQTTRIRRTFLDRAKAYAEKMKAEKLGYDESDVHWYNASQVVALLPLALDPEYAGDGAMDYDRQSPKTEGGRTKKDPALLGDVQTMVVDVRRAISLLDTHVELALHAGSAGEALYDSAVESVVQFLGGPKAFVGRRRVINNAHAQAVTREND